MIYVLSFNNAVCVCLTSTWPHLTCWSGGRGTLRKWNIEKTFYVTVLCTIIMVHKGTNSSYRLVDYIGL